MQTLLIYFNQQLLRHNNLNYQLSKTELCNTTYHVHSNDDKSMVTWSI